MATKVKQLFEIDDYTLEENIIVVDILKNGREKEIKINRNIYQSWLQDSGRLEWVFDTGNYRGEHIQEIGTLAMDDYWQDIMVDKNNDLYDFIVLKMVAEDAFNIKQPLSNILGTHFINTLKEAI